MRQTHTQRGFTFVELIVGVAVFLVIVVAVYNAYVSIFDVVSVSREKLDAIDLVNEELEIVRNLPYADVGISGGIPSGVLQHTQTVTRDGHEYGVTITIRNTDDPFDGTLGGTPNDTSPSDYKLVEVQIDCAVCKKFTPIVVTTRVAPKNLETASTNGALFIRVFDANGNPLPGASVHIENNQASPVIVIDDVTNSRGELQIVDAPPGVNAYEITVTKSGYSTDRTYASTVSNPNPTKPHATVILQQVTSISFIIDRLSSVTVTSATPTCAPVASIDFNMKGSKLIGTGPDVLKYNQNQTTNGAGTLTVDNLEWDAYSFTPLAAGYDLIGTNPLSPVNIPPASGVAVQLIMAPKNPDTLLVVVKDSSTGLPLSGVDVTLSATGFASVMHTTGVGFMGQTDWSGGAGQATSTDATRYLDSDGNIETNAPAGDIGLKQVFGDYAPSGVITSSSFDTGLSSNFQKILWNPIDQPLQTGTPNVRVQIATNNDGGTWNFTGPDGSVGSYYTVTNQNINSVNNGNRYLRYRVFLDTASPAATPNISDIAFTFTSACTPPGQVYFNGLPADSYNLHLTKAGYADQDVPVAVSSSWQSQTVIMVPN